MEKNLFELQSSYQPAGDQWEAINAIVGNFAAWHHANVLLGATGTGKTFTMANVIQKLQKPTLVISHNKTLAAQLATEFKYFFPNSAVHYFVSYFDYYQPESYLPEKDIYIEKEATINKEIEMYRLGALASLITRPDVIIVSSVSSLYGLWQKEYFEEHSIHFEVGKKYDFATLKRQLISMQYKPVQGKIEPGMFDIKGDIIDIFSSTDKFVYRLFFNEDLLEVIQKKDSDSFKDLGTTDKIHIWPSSQYLQDMTDLDTILKKITAEMEVRVDELKKDWKELEAHRIQKRVSYDVRMIKETGFVNGIENYSIYFDKRKPGETPYTIFDYFPDDMLVIMDESHMSVPQMWAMPEWDRSRKTNLIEHWFRLPSAIDHRPLNFAELENTVLWKDNAKKLPWFNPKRRKKNAKTLFVSATPAQYEIDASQAVVEQIIRPTWLLDPITYVYPKSGEPDILEKSLERLLKKKPHVEKYLNWYWGEWHKIDLKDVFENIGE
jgi:excinuclease ABC subunit B